MAKRLKVNIDYFEDYHLFSIVSQLKDYRLTYFINDTLGIDLKKYDDLKVLGKEGTFSWYYFTEGENHPSFYLVGNNHPKGKIFSSQKGIDFYLFIKELYEEDKLNRIAGVLRKINGVLGVFETDLASIKNMDSVIECLELHELEKIIKPSSTKPGNSQ